MPRFFRSTQLRAIVLVLTVALVVVGCAPQQTGPSSAPPASGGAAPTSAPAAAAPATAAPTAASKPAAAPAATAPAAAAAPATRAPAPAAAKPAAPTGGGTLRVGAGADLVTMHPARLSILTDRMMISMVYSTLVRFKLGSTEVLPDLAEKWEKSADGKTYTFHLRKGVQFHKGYGELTSSDVKFTVAFYQDKDKSAKSRQAALFEVVEAVETPDPYTAVFKLSTPFIGFLETLAWQNSFIVSEKAVKELGEDLAFKPIGTGPFELNAWNKGQEVIFTRFPNYFDTPAKLAEVRVKIIPEQTTQILAVSRGELDAAYITMIPALKTARATPGLNIMEQRGNNVNTIRMNMKEGPTANPKLRQALAYAIDTEIMSEASAGLLQSSVTIINPFVFGFSTNVPTYKYDPEKAKALLAESGYKGEQINILYYTSGQYTELAQITKDAWTKIGVNAQLEQVDAATWTARGGSGQFNAYMVGISRNTPDEYFSPSYRTGGAANYGFYSNPEADDLIVKARSQSDEAMGKQLYEKLQQVLLTDLPAIPLNTTTGIWAISPKVKNFTYDTYASIVGFRFVEVE